MHYEERLGAREFKFLVTPACAAEIRAWAVERLSPDSHAGSNGTYRVTSLYFDTAALDVFHRRGSYGRAKYRVRRYDEGPWVYVERKMRTECLVSGNAGANGLGRVQASQPDRRRRGLAHCRGGGWRLVWWLVPAAAACPASRPGLLDQLSAHRDGGSATGWVVSAPHP